MIRRDYLVKQLEEFGKVLARLLMLRKERDASGMLPEIKEAAMRFTHCEIDEVERLNPSELTERTSQLDDHQVKMLADLLFEKLHYYLLTDQQDAASDLKYRCLALYELVRARQSDIFDLSVHYKVQFLQTV